MSSVKVSGIAENVHGDFQRRILTNEPYAGLLPRQYEVDSGGFVPRPNHRSDIPAQLDPTRRYFALSRRQIAY